MAGAADRCVIPEHPFDIDLLCQLLSEDRRRNPSRYSVVLVSEGCTARGSAEMSFEGEERDQFGHRKLGGVGDKVAAALKECSPAHNGGRRVNVVNQRLGYLVRCGDPDALDSIVPMVYGNLALDLVLSNQSGLLVGLHNGRYDHVPIDLVVGEKKVVDVKKYYHTERLRPIYETFRGRPLFLVTDPDVVR
jgi:6-phosphofructokinase 1